MGLKSALGLGGRGDSGKKAAARLSAIASDLRRFRPIRARSALGDVNISEGNIEFTPSEATAASIGSLESFFGSTTRKLAEFDEGDATERTLGLLRRRRQQKSDVDLSRLRSGLVSSGRLGLETGADTTNPEFKAFFAAQQGADLEAQLVASEEARRERGGLLQSAIAGGQGLFNFASGGALTQSAFGLANLGLSRDIAAANIQAGGVQAQLSADLADKNAMSNFLTGVAGSTIEGLFG